MSDLELSGAGGRMRVPRTRGAVSGFALIVLGLWGGLAPFIGPYFDFAFTPQPGNAWHWTAARGWFEVLPGAVALVGGLLLLVSANRAMTLLGAWIAVAAGAWFVVGPEVSPLLTLGSVGSPANGGQREQVLEALVYFTALGAAIVLFGALAAGRLSVHSVRDARLAARRDAETTADETSPDATSESTAVTEPEPEREPEAEPEPAVATSGHPDAPYAPDGHTPEISEPPADVTPQQGGPGYATPQRYVRPEPAQQFPVEQIQRDHPTG